MPTLAIPSSLLLTRRLFAARTFSTSATACYSTNTVKVVSSRLVDSEA